MVETIVTLALGAILGAGLTMISNYFLEIHKASIQRDNLRFTSFHAKHIDVLAEIYKQLSQIALTIEEMIKLVPPGNDHYPKEILLEFINGSSETFEELKEQTFNYWSYYKANSVYLDDEFEVELKLIHNKIFQLVSVREIHRTWINAQETIKIPYNQQLRFSADQIHKLMPDIKSKVKQFLRG